MSAPAATVTRRSRPGRPRHVPESSRLTPREQILDAAARLFTTQGFAATSTREIAEAVGIRQASLYYHFSGKEEMLDVLLRDSVGPTLAQVAAVEEACGDLDPQVTLYALAMVDVATLTEAPHNIGMLALLPEVASSECFEDYREARRELVKAYTRIGGRVQRDFRPGAPRIAGLGEQLMALVETVTGIRRNRAAVDTALASSIAASCLRVCGVHDAAVAFAAETADRVLQSLPGA